MLNTKSIVSIVSAALITAGPGCTALTASAGTLSRGAATRVSVISPIGAGLNSPVPTAPLLSFPGHTLSAPSAPTLPIVAVHPDVLTVAAKPALPTALPTALLPAAAKGAASSADLRDRLLTAHDNPAGIFDGAGAYAVRAEDPEKAVSALLSHLNPYTGEPGPLLTLDGHPLPPFLDAARVILADPRPNPAHIASLAKALMELRSTSLLPDDNFLRQRMRASRDERTIDLLDGWLGRGGALIELHLALLRHPALDASALQTLRSGLHDDVEAKQGERRLETEAARELLGAFESAYFRMPVSGSSFASGYLQALRRSGLAEPGRIVELAIRYERYASVRGEHADLAVALEIFVFKHDKRFYTPEFILSMADAALRHAPAIHPDIAAHVTSQSFERLGKWVKRYFAAGPECDRLLAVLEEKRALALSLAPKPKTP